MGRKHSQKGLNILEKCGLGIEDEDLDFEVDEIEAEHNSSSEDSDISVSERDESTTNQEINNISVNINHSLSGKSHMDEMLPFLPNNSFNSHHSDYLPLQINLSSNAFLDSSNSDEDSYKDAVYPTEEQEASLLESEDDMAEPVNQYIEEPSKPLVGGGNIFSNTLICVSGEGRTFIGANQLSNNLKRTTDFFRTDKVKKRKKWEVTFKNGYKPVRVFLDDIGYETQIEANHIDNNLINANDIGHNSFTNGIHQKVPSESSTSSSFIRITVDQRNSKRFCQKVGSSFSESSLSGSESFKIPLPPAKRPPTRPKRTPSEASRMGFARTISNVGSNSQISISNRTVVSVDDDALSIMAPSIVIDEQIDPETKQEVFSDTDQRMSEMYDDYNNRITNWVQEVQAITRLPVERPVNQVSDNNSTVISNDVRVNQRIPFLDIPAFFQGICFFHYINQNCNKSRCIRPHQVILGKFTTKALNVSREQLLEAYKFILEHDLKQLYKEIYICFIQGFTHHKMKNELIFCVNDFYKFQVNLFDSVAMVISSLEQMGMTFLESIETMMMILGLRLPEFPDVLLELLTARPEIKENWSVIKKIIKTIERVSPKLATKILHSATAVYPLDRQLLLDINEVIIRNELTDLSQISEGVLAAFKCLFSDNNNSRAPITQTIIRLPIQIPSFENFSRDSSVDNIFQPRETTTSNNFHNKRNTDKPATNTRPNERRNCDFRTGQITTSFDGDQNFDECYFEPPPLNPVNWPNENSNPLAPSSSNSSREGSVFSESQYVPQNVVPDNRRDIDIRSLETRHFEYKLSPSPPVIGSTKIPSHFIINKSLHYLYPEVIKYPVSMDECDHLTLKQAILDVDAIQFLRLLDKYKNPVTLEKFIIMTIINLRDNLQEASKTLQQLLRFLGFESLDIQTKKLIKVVFEVTVMNLLIEMKKVCYWGDAVELLEQFTDWDGLVSSQNFGSSCLTHMGRYLFLAWMFSKGRNFHYTYRILMSPDLHLMASPSSWPFFNCSHSDIKYRNEVLDEFLKSGFSNYLLGALHMHKYMLTSDELHGYNRRQEQEYLNLMMKSLIESGKTSNLACCFSFLDCFYKILDKSTLRSLAASAVVDRLNKEQQVQLYDFCCKREIYPTYTGDEDNVVIRTDNSDNEIILVLNFFFYQRSQNPMSVVRDLFVEIKLQEYSGNYIKLLRDCIRSIVDINVAVKNILRDNFNMLVRESLNSFVLEIPSDEVSRVLKEQYNWHPQ